MLALLPNIDLHVFMAPLELLWDSDAILDEGFYSFQFRDLPQTQYLTNVMRRIL